MFPFFCTPHYEYVSCEFYRPVPWYSFNNQHSQQAYSECTSARDHIVSYSYTIILVPATNNKDSVHVLLYIDDMYRLCICTKSAFLHIGGRLCTGRWSFLVVLAAGYAGGPRVN